MIVVRSYIKRVFRLPDFGYSLPEIGQGRGRRAATSETHGAMMSEDDMLMRRLTGSVGLTQAQAERAIEELLDALDETVDAFISRRHDELQRHGYTNREIYAEIARELSERRFRAPELSERQIRRRIYG